jgi:hypothetical protein
MSATAPTAAAPIATAATPAAISQALFLLMKAPAQPSTARYSARARAWAAKTLAGNSSVS